ncbi:hypothetical protein [Sutcliffiella horikoshii]|uniref:Uncharacterized protein n=1 Tax=Sutcliffiella horikoshii TaxID=79883 RepID=A0A5D4TGY3_9BACI|nr:hypothetical protein [Sutcliffiella horikoshii]TYS74535.1 hypothetical protein FZC75_02220 [Sutcliffiella horikoshii]
MFNKKIQTVGNITDFVRGGRPQVEVISTQEQIIMNQAKTAGGALAAATTLPLAIAPFAKVKIASAAGYGTAVPVNSATVAADTMFQNMLHAFDPLITLVQALAYPIAMVVVLGGALFIMIGNKDKGFSMMQSAGLGYVLVTLTPMILNILVEAMKSAV